MTIRLSPPISLTDVMDELRVANPGRSYPISLGDADVRALAGKSSGVISLSDLYGKSGVQPLTANGYGDSASGNSQFGAGTVACSPSVIASGGSGTITYLWEFTSNPNSCALSNATNAACSVSHGYANNATGSASATLRCTVRDGNGAGATVVVNNIGATLDWSGNA